MFDEQQPPGGPWPNFPFPNIMPSFDPYLEQVEARIAVFSQKKLLEALLLLRFAPLEPGICWAQVQKPVASSRIGPSPDAQEARDSCSESHRRYPESSCVNCGPCYFCRPFVPDRLRKISSLSMRSGVFNKLPFRPMVRSWPGWRGRGALITVN